MWHEILNFLLLNHQRLQYQFISYLPPFFTLFGKSLIQKDFPHMKRAAILKLLSVRGNQRLSVFFNVLSSSAL